MENSKELIEEIAKNYEVSLRYLINKSNKRAWLITYVSTFISIISVSAVCLLTPLKSVKPYVIRVNDSGMVDIVTSLKMKDIEKNEALDKYFIANYIRLREGYYWDLLEQDYIQTQMFSSQKVANDYVKIYTGEVSRDKILGDKFEIEVKIISIVLGESGGVKTATIRFKTIKKDLSNNAIATEKSYVATLSYDYLKLDETESQRLNNPLGFQVLTYRLDEEIK